jgi:hypothetical protein
MIVIFLKKMFARILKRCNKSGDSDRLLKIVLKMEERTLSAAPAHNIKQLQDHRNLISRSKAICRNI